MLHAFSGSSPRYLAPRHTTMRPQILPVTLEGFSGMARSARGISTVECLVALTVFSLGALGSVGAVALGIRTAASGTHLSTATRIAGEVLETAHFRLKASNQSCAVLAAGSRNGPAGEVVNWAVNPGDGGARLVLALSYATPIGQRTDTIRGFLRCH